jgi:hypothetical protein
MDVFGDGHAPNNVIRYNFKFKSRILDSGTKTGTDPGKADFTSDCTVPSDGS